MDMAAGDERLAFCCPVGAALGEGQSEVLQAKLHIPGSFSPFTSLLASPVTLWLGINPHSALV